MNTEKDHSYRLRQLYKVQEGSLFNYNMGIIDLAMPLEIGYLFQVLRFSSLGIWDVLKLKTLTSYLALVPEANTM